MAQKKIVHIVGTGTIGEPLVVILSTFREQFGIDEVTFHKRTPLITDRSKVQVSCDKGAKLAVDKESRQKFIEMGMTPTLEAEEAIERASVVIDCTPVGNKNKEKLYNKYANNCAALSPRAAKMASARSTPAVSTIRLWSRARTSSSRWSAAIPITWLC